MHGSANRQSRFSFAGLTLAVLITLLALLPGNAFAAPGDLDRSFGNSGSATATVSGSNENVLRDFISLPDGRMVGVGGGAVGESGFLVRFLEDGSLDSSFGDSGIVRTPNSLWAGVAVQKSGDIITFGRIGKEPAIARFSTSGMPDPAFGDQGSVMPAFRHEFQRPDEVLEFLKLAVDGDDSISAVVLPGSCAEFPSPGPDGDYWEEACPNVITYTFDKDGEQAGRVLLSAGISPETENDADAKPRAVAVTATGEFVVRSEYLTSDFDGNSFPNSAVQKFAADGTQIQEFGDAGVFTYDSSGTYDPGEIVISGDGAITIVDSGVQRLLPDGQLDTKFGKQGSIPLRWLSYTSYLGYPVNPSDFFLAPDGTAYLAGTTNPLSEDRDGYGIRLDEAGSADPTFSTDGLARFRAGDRLKNRQIRLRKGMMDAFVVAGEDEKVTVAATASINGRFRVRLSRFLGGSGDRLECGGKLATVQGTAGDDELFAGEVTVTGDGDDIIDGAGRITCTGDGDDQVTGGSARRIYLGRGNDKAEIRSADVFGGSGRDRILLKNGWGTVRAGDGNDWVQVAGERSEVHGDAGADRIRNISERTFGSSYFGGPGPDRIIGDQGPELFRGGPGPDFLSGKGGPDTMFGDGGRDRLFGGTGSDRLVGGPQRDLLDPGPKGPPLQIYGIETRRVKGELKVLENRVTASDVRVKTECEGVDDHFTDAGLRDAKFKPGSGRFDVDLHFFDGFGLTETGRATGRKTKKSIVVNFTHRADFSYGSDGAFQCRTGYVKFRLSRRADEVQSVTQGS